MLSPKLFFILLLTCTSLCSFAQNKRFYLGFSTGMGGVLTNIDKEVKFSHKVGYAIPSEVNINYSLNDTWTLQAYLGYHIKQFQVSADKLYTHSDFFRVISNFKEPRGNRTSGLNLLFRKPLNQKQKIYLGAMVGYGLNTRKDSWGGSSSSFKDCDTSTPPQFSDFDPSNCERVLESTFSFEGQGSSYLLTGIFSDIRLTPKKSTEVHFLRLSIVNRMVRKTPLQLEGVFTFYEFGEVIDIVPFSSAGSTLSLEVGWLMPL